MDLSVITVTLNAADLISEQIKSVRGGCKNISFEQFVIDNDSSDKTVEVIDNNFPEVILIKNKTNTGFGYPNNQAAKFAKGDFFLFLNPDMRVQEGSLDKIVEWMRVHPEVGLASCKLIDENGKNNRDAAPRRFPGVLDQVLLILKLPHLFPHILDKYLMSDFDPAMEQEVETVRGSFMLVRKEIVGKLGWAFDPRYFIWFEDIDTCREVRRLGYKVMYTPIIECVDYVGQTFKKQSSLLKQRRFTKSMLQYFQKWEPWYKWIIIAIFRPVGILMTVIYELFKKYI